MRSYSLLEDLIQEFYFQFQKQGLSRKEAWEFAVKAGTDEFNRLNE